LIIDKNNAETQRAQRNNINRDARDLRSRTVAFDVVSIVYCLNYNEGMKTLAEMTGILKSKNPYLREKYGVEVVGVFGSYARNEQRPDSDIDILIELLSPSTIGLIGLVELENMLSDLLGVKADIALKKNLRKRIGRRILEETIPV
jgi:predicted nucleotidyltransferase